MHKLHIGSQLPAIPADHYRFETVPSGLVNREWDSVVPGQVYCAELTSRFDQTTVYAVLVEVSEDGRTLTIEAVTVEGTAGTACPEGRFSFSADAHTMYR